MINPYADIDWSSVSRIGSANHMHITDQKALDNGYRYGIRHFPISNYYPSAPYYANTRPSDFRLRQHWPAKRTDGGVVEPPVNWNELITWREELDEPYRARLPFTEGELAFSNVPGDAILSPNAEHHSFTNSPSHICCPGSAFISGNIDPQGNKYRVKDHGFRVGFGGPWQEAFEGMLAEMKFPDSGGITICHPTWFSRLTDDHVFEMLDFDPGVIGIEIYNDYSAKRKWFEEPDFIAPDEEEPGFSLNMWDRILSTGRRCWGFCVPDHSVEKGTNWNGRNILLVAEFTEHECLNAYRQGRFYGCLKDNGLSIDEFKVTESSIFVSVNRKASITFITQTGVVRTVDGESASYPLRPNAGDSNPLFVRVEVADNQGERLFLQPVVFG